MDLLSLGQLAATIDLFPTFSLVAGAKLPSNVTIDGMDMSPLLFQNQPVQIGRAHV